MKGSLRSWYKRLFLCVWFPHLFTKKDKHKIHIIFFGLISTLGLKNMYLFFSFKHLKAWSLQELRKKVTNLDRVDFQLNICFINKNPTTFTFFQINLKICHSTIISVHFLFRRGEVFQCRRCVGASFEMWEAWNSYPEHKIIVLLVLSLSIFCWVMIRFVIGPTEVCKKKNWWLSAAVFYCPVGWLSAYILKNKIVAVLVHDWNSRSGAYVTRSCQLWSRKDDIVESKSGSWSSINLFSSIQQWSTCNGLYKQSWTSQDLRVDKILIFWLLTTSTAGSKTTRGRIKD